jgi:hypothetical protein
MPFLPGPVTHLAVVALRLDERGEDPLTVLGHAVIEAAQGVEILSRVFQVIDDLEVGLTRLLMQGILIMHNPHPP